MSKRSKNPKKKSVSPNKGKSRLDLRKPEYDKLIRSMSQLAKINDYTASTTWNIPSRVSLKRAKYRLRAFIQGDRAPEAPKGKTWHTSVAENKKYITVFLGPKPKRSK